MSFMIDKKTIITTLLIEREEYRHKYLIDTPPLIPASNKVFFFCQIIPYPPLRAILLKAHSY